MHAFSGVPVHIILQCRMMNAVHNFKNTRLPECLDEQQSIEMHAAGMGTPRVDILKFVNYTIIENAHIVRKKHFVFLCGCYTVCTTTGGQNKNGLLCAVTGA